VKQKKKHKGESLILGALFKRLAPRIGASVVLEPVWKMAGQITYKNGKRRYFRYNAVDLNPIGSARVASDKDYANFFMRKLGFPTVDGKTFFRPDFAEAIKIKNRGKAAAYAYAKSLGFPVIVKPNSGSQGSGVFLAHNRKDLDRALTFIFKHDRIALVQRLAEGRDYRVVVLDDEVISAYERIPLSVVGDGTSTIRQLLDDKARYFQSVGRDTQLKMDDARIARKLTRQKLTLRSKPALGERISLLDNANLSTGGDSVDVSETIHPAFKKIAVKLTRDMGLRFSGVDLMIEGDIEQKPVRFKILEINDTPGLDHYATTGPAQRKIVEDMYFEVLKHMQK
jgi:D-alanine-D-alanine ligase-like ATP-grasp enzyme